MLIKDKKPLSKDLASLHKEVCAAFLTSFPDFIITHLDSLKQLPENIVLIKQEIEKAGKDLVAEAALTRRAIDSLSLQQQNYKILAEFYRRLAQINIELNQESKVVFDYSLAIQNYIKAVKYAAAREVTSMLVSMLNQNPFFLTAEPGKISARDEFFRGWQNILVAQLSKRGEGDYSQADEDVAMVEERQVGFSDAKPIGTDNISECIVIILREPRTNQTMMAHLSINNTAEEFRGAVDSFLSRFSTLKLEARLVGARSTGFLNDYKSEENIKKVLSVLADYDNINIESADIWESKSPSAIVYYPAENRLVHAMGIESGENALWQCVTSYQDLLRPKGSSAMSVAFDLTEGKERYREVKIDKWFASKLTSDCRGSSCAKERDIYESVQRAIDARTLIFTVLIHKHY